MAISLNRRKLVLDWDIDAANQDGYLHTRSFPLSLGKEKTFSEIKYKRIPIVIVPDISDKYAIVAISRKKYPGEINSISFGSKMESLLIETIDRNKFLKEKDIIGFSQLYRKILNLIKDADRKKVRIRKGVKIQLYSTNKPFVFILHVDDSGFNTWRDYRNIHEDKFRKELISKDAVELKERKEVASLMALPFNKLLKRISTKRYRKTSRKMAYSEIFARDPNVIAFAMKRSKGLCELCEKKAPFLKDDGRFYLEVHHLEPLSKGGRDIPDNVAALCPNCHRMLHHGIPREKETKNLSENIRRKNHKQFLILSKQ